MSFIRTYLLLFWAAMNIKIINIATANPKLKLSQQDTLAMLCRSRKLSRQEKVLYQRFLSDKGIVYRYFSVDNIEDFFVSDQNILINRFQKSAADLSVSAIEKCIRQSGIDKDKISCLVVSTCTGYLCPGLTSYIVEKASLNPDIFALDIVGMGCGGAMPALRACVNHLNTHQDTYALTVSTEISSAAVFWGDDPELILSNSIFGDGSAACLLTNIADHKGLKMVGRESKIEPRHRDILRLRTEDSRLRNVIKEVVPQIAAEITESLTAALMMRYGFKQGDIKFWAIHPGGRRVLDAIQAKMGLDAHSLDHSRRVLYNYGNMSSPTVLFVLKEIIDDNILNRNDIGIMASFGAGFSGYAEVLMRE